MTERQILTERQKLVKEQDENSLTCQCCHNSLSVLTKQEQTELEELKAAWKAHDIEKIASLAALLKNTRDKILKKQILLKVTKKRIKEIKEQLKKLPPELDLLHAEQNRLNLEIQLLKHGGVLKKCSEKVIKTKEQLKIAIKSKDYSKINKASHEVINAIGQLNSNLIKLKSIKKRMKANHAMIQLLKMNQGDKK